MLRGVWLAATGMMKDRNRLDTIAGNLANANTAGFKRIVGASMESGRLGLHRVGDCSGAPWIGELSMGASQQPNWVDASRGSFVETGNPFDVALQGAGFFEILTPSGPRYTSDGRFAAGADGTLVTLEGDAVVGRDGSPISLGVGREEAALQISPDGTVIWRGDVVGALRVVEFAFSDGLVPEGAGRYRPSERSGQPEPVRPEEVSVLQGWLECSNVDPIREMVDLVLVMRSYEASQRALKAHDETASKLVNEVGRA